MIFILAVHGSQCNGYGGWHGDIAGIWVDEDDIAMYVLMTVDDPRTLNKTVYLRPPQNILSQKEVVAIWEGLIGKQLEKTFLSDQELLGMMNSMAYIHFLLVIQLSILCGYCVKVRRNWDLDAEFELPHQVGLAHVYQIFCKGDLDFEVEGPNKVDSNDLYPDYKYVTAEEYLKRFV